MPATPSFLTTLVVLLFSAGSSYAQAPALPSGPIQVEVVNRTPPVSPWLDLSKSFLAPSLGGALAALVGVYLTLRSNRQMQADRLLHERGMAESQRQHEEHNAVQEWFLQTYTVEAIEPVEAALLWLNEIMLWGSEENVSADLREKVYTCMARIAVVIDSLNFLQLFNLLVLATEALLRVRRLDPDLYDSLGTPLQTRLTLHYKEAFLFINHVQEAMRFTTIKHRSDVYRLGKTEQFAHFATRAEALIVSLDVRQFTALVQRAEKQGPPQAQ